MSYRAGIDVDLSHLSNFSVTTDKNVYTWKKLYVSFKKHNIKRSIAWNGSSAYYGINENNNHYASNIKFGMKQFKSYSEWEHFVNQEQLKYVQELKGKKLQAETKGVIIGSAWNTKSLHKTWSNYIVINIHNSGNMAQVMAQNGTTYHVKTEVMHRDWKRWSDDDRYAKTSTRQHEWLTENPDKIQFGMCSLSADVDKPFEIPLTHGEHTILSETIKYLDEEHGLIWEFIIIANNDPKGYILKGMKSEILDLLAEINWYKNDFGTEGYKEITLVVDYIRKVIGNNAKNNKLSTDEISSKITTNAIRNESRRIKKNCVSNSVASKGHAIGNPIIPRRLGSLIREPKEFKSVRFTTYR